MAASMTYASFLVRLWREGTPPLAPPLSGEGEGGGVADWQSEVEHIQSGGRWAFPTLDELLDFLRRQTDDPDV